MGSGVVRQVFDFAVVCRSWLLLGVLPPCRGLERAWVHVGGCSSDPPCPSDQEYCKARGVTMPNVELSDIGTILGLPVKPAKGLRIEDLQLLSPRARSCPYPAVLIRRAGAP